MAFPVVDVRAGVWSAGSIARLGALRGKARLGSLASFHLIVYGSRRAFHPDNLCTSWKASRLIRSLRPDILHFDDVSARAVAIPYLVGQIPSVVSVHDTRPHACESAGRIDLVRRLFLRKARGLIFHSRHAKRDFLQQCPETALLRYSHVIPLGVYDVFRHFCCETCAVEPNTVMFFGRISPYKGMDTLLAAAPLIAERVAGLRVIIAGKPVAGYEMPGLPELPNGGEWESHLGPITCEQLCTLFQRAVLVVLPYMEVTQSGVVSTAYAFHKPVVVTSVGGLREMVDENETGEVVPPGDPQALAGAVIGLLSDPNRLSKMRDVIRDKNEGELGWENLVAQTLGVYRSTVARHSESIAG